MEITTKTTKTIKFQVYSCWSQEGGMGDDYFGDEVEDMKEALHLLEVAQQTQTCDAPWFIMMTVKTTHS